MAVRTPINRSGRARAMRADQRAWPTLRELALAWTHLAVLWTFAVSLPLFQLFDTSPDFLIAQDNQWPDIALVSIALVVVPPSAMVLGEALVARLGRSSELLHLAFIAAVTSILVLQILKDQFDPARRSLALAALMVGVAFAFAFSRGRFLPHVLTVLSPAPVVALVWFLGFSSVAALAWPAGDQAVDAPEVEAVPVVLVILDEISTASLLDGEGRISRRWPHFAALAREGTWFRSATTAADNTTRAVPAILAGRLGPKGALPTWADHTPNLFELLDGQMRFHVDEPVTHLCPNHLCPPPSFWSRAWELTKSMRVLMSTRLRPGTTPEFLGLPDITLEDRPARFQRFSEQLGPGLNVLHIELPHNPYQYDAGGKYTTVNETPGLTGEQWTTDPAPVREGLGRYLRQVDQTDRLLGILRRELRASGLYDRSLVIVTADHGVSFVPGRSRRDVTVENVGEIGGIPMFLKAPQQRTGLVSDAPVNTLDVLPTIGDYLGVDWRSEGQSMRRPASREEVSVSAQFGPLVRMPVQWFQRLRDEAAERLRRDAKGDHAAHG